MYRNVLLLLILLVTKAAAQKGTVTGTITAEEAGRIQPMPFVNVALKGAGVSANTDLDGKFTMTAEPGAYTLVVSFVGYEPTERAVTVTAGERTLVDVEMKGQGIEMKSLDVVTTKRTETETAVVMETRKSEQVVNGVGRQQIAKSQDRNAGDVVKRIPGVTLVNDRFVMVRGLADRYNAVMLNDVIAPSLESDKRAFSFDLIPSGALDRVMLYKTGAPELPGEFAGGVVRIHTLSVPQENETRVNYSASFRVGTTGSSFLTDKAGKTDALGMDLGARALPSDFPANVNTLSGNQLATAGQSLSNYWSANTTTALPDQRLGILIARRFGKEGGTQFGNVTTLDYALTSVAFTAKNYNYGSFVASTGRSDSLYRYSDQENIRNARISLLHNWTALIGTRSKIEFKNLLNQQGEGRTTSRTGIDFDGGFDVNNVAFRWQERTIYSGQLHGTHDLANDRTNIQWTAGYGLALSKEPDYRRARTTRAADQSDSDTPYQIQISPTASTTNAGRFFSDLDEHVITGRLDVEEKVGSGTGKVVGKLRAGVFTERKDREFSARWMSFVKSNFNQFDESLLMKPLDVAFSDANINATTGFKLSEGTNPSDAYTAANTLMAGYLGSTFTFDSTTTVSVGARVEHNRQELTSGTYTNGEVGVDNTVISVLPSLNASYNLTKRSLVRVAVSQSVNRPEFRELAPFSFYDFSSNSSLSGNPDLKTARILNLDARWEFYPTLNETMSIGVFYKSFTDPIETFFVSSTGGGTRNLTYKNAANANSLGVEAEVRRSAASLSSKPWAEKWGVVLNASVIKSTVELGDQAVGQKKERPMMGQSPYVANAGIYFDDTAKGVRASVLWNVFGRRLYAVGNTLFPDIYEMPRNSLDVTASKRVGKHFEVKLSAQDILNQHILLVQDSDANGSIDGKDADVLSFRRGQYFSAGLQYTF
ncbi:MAG TPA: TonB-dependent receptor [Flavobacteriales bacterium]|nr:TonB-dependent receptor [Flavobacteriales bacterium]